MGYASQGDILSVMAKQIGIEYIDFRSAALSPTRSRSLLGRWPRATRSCPSRLKDGVLLVAMADPQNVLALDDLRILTGHDIKPAISTKDDIIAAIEEFYTVAEHADEDMFLGTEDITDEELGELTGVESEAPAVKLVNYIIQKAVADRASDIHIEPQENDLRVRFRVDGVLHEAMPPAPKSIQTSIISRFKIMADMDIAESRKPQDGHCAVSVGGPQDGLPSLDASDRLWRARRAANPAQGLDSPAAVRPWASCLSRWPASRARSPSRTGPFW